MYQQRLNEYQQPICSVLTKYPENSTIFLQNALSSFHVCLNILQVNVHVLSTDYYLSIITYSNMYCYRVLCPWWINYDSMNLIRAITNLQRLGTDVSHFSLEFERIGWQMHCTDHQDRKTATHNLYTSHMSTCDVGLITCFLTTCTCIENFCLT